MKRLDFWEKVISNLFFRAISYDVPEKDIDKIKKNRKIKDLMREINISCRNISEDISMYTSEKIKREIKFDELYLNTLSKVVENMRQKNKSLKKVKEYNIMFNILKRQVWDEVSTALEDNKENIIDYTFNKAKRILTESENIPLIKNVNGCKCNDEEKEEVLSGVVLPDKDKTKPEELKVKSGTVMDSLYGKFKEYFKGDRQELISFYLQYMASKDIFKIIQSDNIMITLPLKGLLTNLEQFIDTKQDLINLRMKKRILLESPVSFINREETKKKLQIDSLDNYLFVVTHHWLKHFIAPRDYIKRVKEEDALLFKTQLDVSVDIYNKLLKELITEVNVYAT